MLISAMVISCMASILFYYIAWMQGNLNLAMVSVMALFIFNIVFCLHRIYKRASALLFYAAFFTFLLGGGLLAVLAGEQWWEDFNTEEAWHVIHCLVCTLVSLPVGIKIYEEIRFKKRGKSDLLWKSEQEAGLVESLRTVSKYIFWFTLWASLYVIFSKILFVRRNGYLAYYTSYVSVSGFILKLQYVNDCAFMFFLATLPKMKVAKLPMAAWFVTHVITILSGGRASAVTAVFLFIWYFNYRNRVRTEGEKAWFTKWMKWALILGAPLAIAFLGYWTYARANLESEFGVLKAFYVFFKDQGGSLDLIAYAKRYQEDFPQSMYTFGPLINFVRGNTFGRILFGFVMPRQNTVEMALTGYNFGQTISWLVMPHNYVAGVGLGGCYIAEVWLDFGFAGVIICNMLLGILLGFMGESRRYSVVGLYLVLMVFSNVMLLPRDAALTWFSSIFNFTVILTTVGILFLARLYWYSRNPGRNVLYIGK